MCQIASGRSPQLLSLEIQNYRYGFNESPVECHLRTWAAYMTQDNREILFHRFKC